MHNEYSASGRSPNALWRQQALTEGGGEEQDNMPRAKLAEDNLVKIVFREWYKMALETMHLCCSGRFLSTVE